MSDTSPPPDADEAEPAESDSPTLGALRSLIKSNLAHWRGLLVPRRPEFSPPRWRRAHLLATYVVRRFLIEDRCGGMAAILTIHTLLSTVPIFGVALLVVGLMDPTEGERRLTELFVAFVPETSRASEMAEAGMQLASNVTVGNLGAWGFLVALVIGFVLFQNLEGTVNRIWRVQRSRNLLIKFMMFYTLATLGPALMFYSLAHPFLPGMGDALGIPFVLSSVGLVLLNRFLPFADVRWRGALAGGLVSAVLFELGKIGFGFYATRFALQTYEGLYGPLAILPILVVWSYLSWMVILLGAEIAYVVQHRRTIALMGFMNRYILDRLAIQGPSGRTATRLLLAICDQYARRELGLSAENLAGRFGIGLDVVAEVLGRLQQAGLVLAAEPPIALFLPARPLDQLTVGEVLALFDADHTRHVRDDRLTRVFASLDDATAQLVGSMSFATLVAHGREASNVKEPLFAVASDAAVRDGSDDAADDRRDPE